MGWIIVFVISWGLGALICGITAWRKDNKTTKVAAIIFFGLPIVFLVIDLAKQSLTQNNYEAAVEEVKQLCAKDGGDKIYKTVDNVQGVLQMRRRQPESYKDEKGSYRQWMSDQYGMEDPYGKAQNDDDDVSSLVGYSSHFPESPPRGKQGYWFIEQQTMDGKEYRRSYLSAKINRYNERQELSDSGEPLYKVKELNVNQLKSRYGYLTEDLTTKEMRDKWIGAGRIKIIDLKTNEVLAERKGYFRADGDYLPPNADRWTATGAIMQNRICPSNKGLLQFLHSVLKPADGFPTIEQLESIARD